MRYEDKTNNPYAEQLELIQATVDMCTDDAWMLHDVFGPSAYEVDWATDKSGVPVLIAKLAEPGINQASTMELDGIEFDVLWEFVAERGEVN